MTPQRAARFAVVSSVATVAAAVAPSSALVAAADAAAAALSHLGVLLMSASDAPRAATAHDASEPDLHMAAHLNVHLFGAEIDVRFDVTDVRIRFGEPDAGAFVRRLQQIIADSLAGLPARDPLDGLDLRPRDRAILLDWRLERSVTEIARDHDLEPKTVYNIVGTLRANLGDELVPHRVHRQPGDAPPGMPPADAPAATPRQPEARQSNDLDEHDQPHG